MKWAAGVFGLCVALSLGLSGTAEAKARHRPDGARAAAVKTPGRAARSLGTPSQGKLVGGKRIARSPALRVVGSLQFALPALVDMLERSADRVAKKNPGSVLTVGDLSAKDGGEVNGHRSHESGRDADVGFYLTKSGKQFLPGRFAAIDDDGKAVGLPGVRFDDARNWALVEAFLTDPSGRVLQIFVAKHLRARLLAQAARAGASGALRARAAQVLMQPSRALPHDNHFHVRVACPPGDHECINFDKRKARPTTASRKKAPRVRTRR